MWPAKPPLPSNGWNPMWASCVSQVWWEWGCWELWPAVCVSPSQDLLPLCHMNCQSVAPCPVLDCRGRMSLGLKLCTVVGSAADLGSSTVGPVLPTPRWHLGAGNGSPVTAEWCVSQQLWLQTQPGQKVINFRLLSSLTRLPAGAPRPAQAALIQRDLRCCGLCHHDCYGVNLKVRSLLPDPVLHSPWCVKQMYCWAR